MRIRKDIIFAIAFQKTYTISKKSNKKPREPKNKRKKSFYCPHKKPGEKQDNRLLKRFKKNNSNKILIKDNFKR